MKKLGTWLGIVAIALQVAWPLAAGAKLRSVMLVPLCTVDGVTHYLEVPTGKAPADESSAHGDHCPLCFLGERVGLAVQFQPLVLPAPRAEAFPSRSATLSAKAVGNVRHARAPPFSRVTTCTDDNFGRYDEEEALASPARCGARGDALERGRFVRLGVLHDQH